MNENIGPIPNMKFTETYTEWGGAEITTTYGSLTGITWSRTRKPAPIYTLGPPEEKIPNLGVAGSLIFKDEPENPKDIPQFIDLEIRYIDDTWGANRVVTLKNLEVLTDDEYLTEPHENGSRTWTFLSKEWPVHFSTLENKVPSEDLEW